MIMVCIIVYIKLNNEQNRVYYLNNNVVHGSHMSNFVFPELSIIESLLSFNSLIKPSARFLTKLSKSINVIDCIHITGTTP